MNWILFYFTLPLIVFFHEAGHYAFTRRDSTKFEVVKSLGLPVIGVRFCTVNMTVFDYLMACCSGFAFSLPVVFLTSFVSLKLMLVLFLVAFGLASVDFYWFFNALFLMRLKKETLQSPIDSVFETDLRVFN